MFIAKIAWKPAPFDGAEGKAFLSWGLGRGCLPGFNPLVGKRQKCGLPLCLVCKETRPVSAHTSVALRQWYEAVCLLASLFLPTRTL